MTINRALIKSSKVLSQKEWEINLPDDWVLLTTLKVRGSARDSHELKFSCSFTIQWQRWFFDRLELFDLHISTIDVIWLRSITVSWKHNKDINKLLGNRKALAEKILKWELSLPQEINFRKQLFDRRSLDKVENIHERYISHEARRKIYWGQTSLTTVH